MPNYRMRNCTFKAIYYHSLYIVIHQCLYHLLFPNYRHQYSRLTPIYIHYFVINSGSLTPLLSQIARAKITADFAQKKVLSLFFAFTSISFSSSSSLKYIFSFFFLIALYFHLFIFFFRIFVLKKIFFSSSLPFISISLFSYHLLPQSSFRCCQGIRFASIISLIHSIY